MIPFTCTFIYNYIILRQDLLVFTSFACVNQFLCIFYCTKLYDWDSGYARKSTHRKSKHLRAMKSQHKYYAECLVFYPSSRYCPQKENNIRTFLDKSTILKFYILQKYPDLWKVKFFRIATFPTQMLCFNIF